MEAGDGVQRQEVVEEALPGLAQLVALHGSEQSPLGRAGDRDEVRSGLQEADDPEQPLTVDGHRGRVRPLPGRRGRRASRPDSASCAPASGRHPYESCHHRGASNPRPRASGLIPLTITHTGTARSARVVLRITPG